MQSVFSSPPVFTVGPSRNGIAYYQQARHGWCCKLQTMIQEAFQRCLNEMAPTASHHGYAPTLPYQNAFGALEAKDSNDEPNNTVTTQVAALTYQSQCTASTVAISSQQAEQQFAHLASQQNLMHKNMHQIIAQVDALSFNQSDVGGSCGCTHGQGRITQQGRGCGPPMYTEGQYNVAGGFPAGLLQGGDPPDTLHHGLMADSLTGAQHLIAPWHQCMQVALVLPTQQTSKYSRLHLISIL
jgi:hypothetical protein